jgi:hypothetical protein
MLRVIILNVTYKPFMLKVTMLTVVMLNVGVLSVMAPHERLVRLVNLNLLSEMIFQYFTLAHFYKMFEDDI